MQSGLIRADSHIPHRRQQTHRNVQQIGYTLQTHRLTHSSNPHIVPEHPLPCVCVSACRQTRKTPESWEQKVPQPPRIRGGLVPKSRSMKAIIAYHSRRPNYQEWTVNFCKLHVSYHHVLKTLLMFSAWELVMRRKTPERQPWQQKYAN